MPNGARLDIVSIAEIPLYNGDVEAASGIPPSAMALKDAIAGADGVLLVTPEYNNGIPGVFKNAIDWASRPAADIARVFAGKPVAVIGASPGGFGTILSQEAWLSVLRTLGTDFWSGGRLMVSGAGKAFDDEGNLTDEMVRGRLKTFLSDFTRAIAAR
jgi:NAD(P)H-dependent FMN reductase